MTREGWLWLVLTLGLWAMGLYKGINLVTLLAYIMMLAWCLNAYLAKRQVRQLRLRRWIDTPAFAQTPLAVEVELCNLHQQRRAVRLEDRGEAHQFTCFLPTVAPGERVRHGEAVVLPWRGWYDWQPLRACSAYPFGLVEHATTPEGSQRFLVYPALGTLHRGRLRRFLDMAAAVPGRVRRKPRHQLAAQAEFHGLREFRPGDSPRWIHWRTSARRGCLMVREFEELPSDHLILVLDPWFADNQEPSDRSGPLLERAVSLAATICWEWCRQKGDRLVLAVAGADAPVIVQGTTGLELAHRALEALAVVSGSARIHADKLVDGLMDTELPAAPILVVSTRPDELGASLSQRLHQAVAGLNVVDLEHYDFYEPGDHDRCRHSLS